MSIYVALTQIKISDESGLRHTARQADLRRRATAPADEAARAAMAIPGSRHSYTPIRIRIERRPLAGSLSGEGPAEPGEGPAEPGAGPAEPGEGRANGED